MPLLRHRKPLLIAMTAASTAPVTPATPATAIATPLQVASVQLLRCRAASRPHEMFAALTELACCYAEQNGFATAEAYLDEALSWSHALCSHDGQVDTLCHLAELTACAAEAQERQNKGSGQTTRDRAKTYAMAASELAPKVADPAWEVKVLLRASDVLDHCGHRVEAIELQIRAVQLLGLEAVRA